MRAGPLAATLLAASLFLLSGVVSGALPSSAATVQVRSSSYSSGVQIAGLASHGRSALLVIALSNGSTELVRYDARTQASTVVLASVNGGIYAGFGSIVATGSRQYMISFFNGLSGRSFFEEVGPGGAHLVHLPLSHQLQWTFVYGGAASFFATSSSGGLFELSPKPPFTVLHNYSSALPAGVGIGTVLPLGSVVYLGGTSYNVTHASTHAWFGILTRATGTVRSVTHASGPMPAGRGAAFFTIASDGTHLWVGGSETQSNLTSFGFHTVAGLLYRYDPVSGSWRNASALLPNPVWGVFGSGMIRHGLVLSLNSYTASFAGLATVGGLYSLVPSSSGPTLVNRTALLPSGYAPDVLDVSASSNGWFFSGGQNTTSGVAEVVTLRG